MLEMTEVYQLDDNIILKSINNSFWALDTRLGGQYKLNSVSYEILDRINGKDSLQDIFDSLLRNYNVSEEDCYVDFSEFIQKSINKNIIIKK